MFDLSLLCLLLRLVDATLLPIDEYNLGAELDVSELGSIGQTTFALVKIESSWKDAEMACRDYYSHGAGTLAKPDSFQRHQLTRALMKDNRIQRVWIGLNAFEHEKMLWADWKCSSFNESEFNRLPDDPAVNSVKFCFLLEEDSWLVESCSSRHFFVCQYHDLQANVDGCTNKDGGSLFQSVGISFYFAPFSVNTWSPWSGTSNFNWWNAGFSDGDPTGQTTVVDKCKSRCGSTSRCILAVEAKDNCLLGIAVKEKKTFVRRQCYRGEVSTLTRQGGDVRVQSAVPDYTCSQIKVFSLLSEYRSEVDQFTRLESIDLASGTDVSTLTTTWTTTETVSFTTTSTTSVLMTQTVTTTIMSYPSTNDPTTPVKSTQATNNETTTTETSLSPSFNPIVTQRVASSENVASTMDSRSQFSDNFVSESSFSTNSQNNTAGRISIIESSIPSVIVTSSVHPTQTPRSCITDPPALLNLTQDDIHHIRRSIVSELLINKQVLSSTRRKKESSPDPRTTATACGGFAITMLVFVLVTFVLMDVKTLAEATRLLIGSKRN